LENFILSFNASFLNIEFTKNVKAMIRVFNEVHAYGIRNLFSTDLRKMILTTTKKSKVQMNAG